MFSSSLYVYIHGASVVNSWFGQVVCEALCLLWLGWTTLASYCIIYMLFGSLMPHNKGTGDPISFKHTELKSSSNHSEIEAHNSIFIFSHIFIPSIKTYPNQQTSHISVAALSPCKSQSFTVAITWQQTFK